MQQTHIVVMDDNSTGIKVMAEMLSLIGVTYTTVQDPTKLADTVQMIERIDVIFLDLEMPKIDGYTMVKILKEELGLAAPVIAYSVHTSEIDVTQQMGFDGFVGKPLDRNRFPEQLKRILNGEQVWEVA